MWAIPHIYPILGSRGKENKEVDDSHPHQDERNTPWNNSQRRFTQNQQLRIKLKLKHNVEQHFFQTILQIKLGLHGKLMIICRYTIQYSIVGSMNWEILSKVMVNSRFRGVCPPFSVRGYVIFEGWENTVGRAENRIKHAEPASGQQPGSLFGVDAKHNGCKFLIHNVIYIYY